MVARLNSILHESDKQHLMLLYDDEAVRNAAEIDCINEGLNLGQFCVYASVNVQDRDFVVNLASRIDGYDRHVQEGNLLLVNFMPFYDSAAKADLTLFEGLKGQIEATLQNRIASGKSGKVLIVADAACNLTKHKQFGECVALESWWQGTYIDWARRNLDITIICAHPSSVLKHESHSKDHISQVHSLTIDLQEHSKPLVKNRTKIYQSVSAKPIRILIAEPEPDIQEVYKAHLRSLPVDVVIVDEGKKCLECALTPGSKESFDMIIVDSHLQDVGGIEVAKKILEEKPNQHIVLTTTRDPNTIRAHLSSDSFDSDASHILVKPFRFSQLLSLIKPAESRLN